jgi:hypothetical protein
MLQFGIEPTSGGVGARPGGMVAVNFGILEGSFFPDDSKLDENCKMVFSCQI